jgi:leader peptidase (prepilin peptidase) / N-methyltransferase
MLQNMIVYLGFVIFVFGLLFGSFANVCIWRLPRHESVAFPGSHCPGCGAAIAWFDNIPLLSFAVLGAKCRSCRAAISWRYPLVELLSGLLFLACWLKYGPDWRLLGYVPLCWSLLVISAVDIDHYIIPDAVAYPAIALGLLLAVLASAGLPLGTSVMGFGSGIRLAPLLDSLAGIAAGAGFLWLSAWAGKKIFKQDAMGGGDIMLAAMIGAMLGWKAMLVALLASFILGTAVGLVLMLCGRALDSHQLAEKYGSDGAGGAAPGPQDMGFSKKAVVPFGPFLAAGALIAVFCGTAVMSWYLGLFGF